MNKKITHILIVVHSILGSRIWEFRIRTICCHTLNQLKEMKLWKWRERN